MNKYYVTFMFKQTPLKNLYMVIESKSNYEARCIAVAWLGDQWGFIYEEEKFLPQIKEFGLSEISMEEASKLLFTH